MFPSFVLILSYDITCLLSNPPLPTPRYDAVPALHTHDTAVHTRGQHLFSPLHISSLYIHVYCRYITIQVPKTLKSTPYFLGQISSLFAALVPLFSLIRPFGRCGRFRGEVCFRANIDGTVLVFCDIIPQKSFDMSLSLKCN